MTNNILVIGGTGKTGSRVAERLHKLNQHVRIGTHNNNPAFDWNDPSTFGPALSGMDMAYVVYYPDLAVPGAKDAIKALTDAAKASSVRKLVLLSGKGEREAERCEEIVANSGLEYTLVRATWFNQNFSESFFRDPIAAGHLALPMPEARVPYVDAGDIADVVVEALMNDEHNGQTYELTGPRAITFQELVNEISNATNRHIKYQPVSLDEFKSMLQEQGLPEDLIWLLSYLFSEVIGSEWISAISNDVQKVLGRPPKDFAEFVNESADKGVWNYSESVI
jgi:uncharacterized protein YbjT (DUF2867 family)